MFLKFKREYAFVVFSVCLFVETPLFAHMGITPFKVLGSMERQGTGPFALSKQNGQDAGRVRLGVEVEQDHYGEMDGLLTHRVRQKSPAANAGIMSDDFIISFNSGRVRSVYDLEAYIRKIPTGGSVSVVVLRDGTQKEFYVTFAGAYEKSRLRVGPSAMGVSGNVGPGKMFEKVKNKEIGPNSVFEKMRKNGTGPFSVIKNKTKLPNYAKDAPVIPPIDGAHALKGAGDKPVLPPIGEDMHKPVIPPIEVAARNAERVDLDALMGDFSMYIENKEALGLSAKQLAKIRKLDAEQKKKNFQKESQLKLVQIELGKIFTKGVDFAAVERLLNFASDVERDWRMDYLDSLKNLYSILTPKQKTLVANPS